MEIQALVSKRLLWSQTLHFLVDSIASVLLTLFIWKTTSLGQVIGFRLQETLWMFPAGILVGWVADRFSPKLSLVAGTTLLGVQLVMVIFLGDEIRNWLGVLAVISGLSTVARFMSISAINQTAMKPDQQLPFFGKLSVVTRLVGIIFPLVSGLVLSFWGYTPLFAIGALVVVAMMLVVLQTPLQTPQTRYQPWLIWWQWSWDKTALLVVNLLWGIELGLFVTAIPILITHYFGGELGWGLVSAGLALIAMVYARLLSKQKVGRALISSVAVFGFLLAGAAITFAVTAQTVTFLVFLILLQLWQVTQLVGLRPLMSSLIKHDPNIDQLATEYAQFMDVPYLVGRLIGLALLLAINNQLTNPLVAGLVFAVMGLIPLYETKALSLSKRLDVA